MLCVFFVLMINQILIYTRPWEVRFHVDLGMTLAEFYPDIPLKFVTFFYETYEFLKKLGFDVLLFTEELKRVDLDETIGFIDQELYHKLGLNLRLLSGMERFLPRDECSAEEFIKRHTLVLNRLVVDGTLSISSMYDHFVYLLGGLLANIRNGFHFAFLSSGMPANRVIALKTPWETWSIKRSEEESLKLLEEARLKMSIPATQRISYMSLDWNFPVWQRFWKTIREYIALRDDMKRGNYFIPTPFNRIKNSVFVRFKSFFKQKSNCVFDFNDPHDLEGVGQPFVYCPLHMEPEATILMYSPWLRDQIEMCRLISQSLPSNILLFVKENPKMIGLRKKDFYQRLKELPNIRLISEGIESKLLIEKCIGVVTLAGTACLEAAVMKKNSLCFGRPPFGDILNNFDYMNTGNLRELNKVFSEWSNDPEFELNIKHWLRWVNGTISGNIIAQKNNGVVEIIPEKHTRNNIVSFINEIITRA